MAQGVAHDGERGSMVDSVRPVTVPQPMGGYLVPVLHASPLCCLAHDTEDGRRVQPRALVVPLARDFLARAKDEVRVRGLFSYGRENVPGSLRQQHVALLVALAAHDVELNTFFPADDVAPSQVT